MGKIKLSLLFFYISKTNRLIHDYTTASADGKVKPYKAVIYEL